MSHIIKQEQKVVGDRKYYLHIESSGGVTRGSITWMSLKEDDTDKVHVRSKEEGREARENLMFTWERIGIQKQSIQFRENLPISDEEIDSTLEEAWKLFKEEGQLHPTIDDFLTYLVGVIKEDYKHKITTKQYQVLRDYINWSSIWNNIDIDIEEDEMSAPIKKGKRINSIVKKYIKSQVSDIKDIERYVQYLSPEEASHIIISIIKDVSEKNQLLAHDLVMKIKRVVNTGEYKKETT